MAQPEKNRETELTGAADFDLTATFECGQCFRWNADENGVYTGVAMNRAVRVRRDGARVFISGTAADFERVWRPYFDLELDYAEIRSRLQINGHMARAARFGAGLRILRQDRWEALCSFILSQCNNIPRIKRIIEALCREFGDPILFDGDTYYGFPPPERLAGLSETDLAPLRAGYRAKYILSAAEAVASGALDLAGLAQKSPEEALTALKRLDGVGDKVASCAVLFGLHMLDAFPIDTWMKKAIARHYGDGFDPKIFSPYAGLAQQYMFYYERSGRKQDEC
ncbi:MAG: DNA-3-methyladenine glycosylase 2 family protein [Oscillospiraceae bacterium]|jgi:N-glycosylase/DNA lyase|nr:DNA-3-methyladenine glycosylase 2 family protein [Oscillospiraceae bacterium]